jgi:predicted PurR-regulated permease PerM
VTVTLVFATLGLAGWALSRQTDELTSNLPGYRANIREKIADVRGASKGGAVEKIQETLEGIRTDLGASAPEGTVSRPVVVTSTPSTGFSGFTWLGPIVGPLGTAGLVAALVIFMLLERRDLRDRLIGLIGGGRLATTTRAFDEAAQRVSRQLLMQSLVSVLWGAMALIALHLLHVPYALVFATLGAALRFIPYLGPIVGAGAPVLVSLAALDGWVGPLSVVAFFIALELFTNLVLETVLYAGAVGVSQVALLMSVAFWTWLWGPLGLLMASPLTVCLVVIGKHVPGLAFIGTLMADSGVLAPDTGYYQRLLARDQGEAAEMIDRHIAVGPPDSVFDALMVPALGYAERDRIEERLSPDEEAAIIEATRELLADVAEERRLQPVGASPAPAPLDVLGYAVGGPADEVALAMLAQVCADLPLRIEITRTRLRPAELIAAVRAGGFSVVCFADLPPSPSSKTRYFVKRLRAALPDVHIAVGRWGPPILADEGGEALLSAGASHLASTLIDSRDYLGRLSVVTPS